MVELVLTQKSELQTKSRRCSRAEPRNPNRIAQKKNPNGVWELLQKTPLKAFPNPLNLCAFSFLSFFLRTRDNHVEPECTKIAHRRSLAIFAADSGIAGNSAVGIKFGPLNRRENRRSLAIFFADPEGPVRHLVAPG